MISSAAILRVWIIVCFSFMSPFAASTGIGSGVMAQPSKVNAEPRENQTTTCECRVTDANFQNSSFDFIGDDEKSYSGKEVRCGNLTCANITLCDQSDCKCFLQCVRTDVSENTVDDEQYCVFDCDKATEINGSSSCTNGHNGNTINPSDPTTNPTQQDHKYGANESSGETISTPYLPTTANLGINGIQRTADVGNTIICRCELQLQCFLGQSSTDKTSTDDTPTNSPMSTAINSDETSATSFLVSSTKSEITDTDSRTPTGSKETPATTFLVSSTKSEVTDTDSLTPAGSKEVPRKLMPEEFGLYLGIAVGSPFVFFLLVLLFIGIYRSRRRRRENVSGQDGESHTSGPGPENNGTKQSAVKINEVEQDGDAIIEATELEGDSDLEPYASISEFPENSSDAQAASNNPNRISDLYGNNKIPENKAEQASSKLVTFVEQNGQGELSDNSEVIENSVEVHAIPSSETILEKTGEDIGYQ